MSKKSVIERGPEGSTIRSKQDFRYFIEHITMYLCNECGLHLEKSRYACSECSHYDSCASCASKKLHEHLLYREDRQASNIVQELNEFKTTGEMLRRAFHVYGHRYAFGYRDASLVPSDSTSPSSAQDPSSKPPLPPYRWVTYEETGRRVDHIGRALRQLVEPRTFVGLCSRVQYAQYLADFACQIHSIIGPVFTANSSLEDIIHIVNRTGMKLIFASAATLPRFLAAVPSCPTLEFIIQLEDLDDNSIHPSILEARRFTRQFEGKTVVVKPASILDQPFSVPFWSQVIVETLEKNLEYSRPLQLTPDQAREWRSKILAAPKPAVLCIKDLELLGVHLPQPIITPTKPNDLETLIFTSGSTGLPKGAMFSAETWHGHSTTPASMPTIERSITWTISDRQNDIRHLFLGGAVAIYNGDITRIFEDIADVRPHQLKATPTFWNKLYTEFQAELKERTRHLSRKVDPTLVSTASSSAPSAAPQPSSIESSSSEADSNGPREPAPLVRRLTKKEKAQQKHAIREVLLKEYRELVGGRVERITTGGAPTSKEVLDWLWDCFSGRVAESYGTTESGGITTRGEFASGLNWKLIPWEDYTPDDQPLPRGELCVKSIEGMMQGYFGEKELTAAAIDDEGFYHTGDIVELNSTHSGATIVDRKKNIFKLSQGEFVAPAKIEKLIQTVPHVRQVFVYGTPNKDSLVAVIVPQVDAVRLHYSRHQESLGLPPIEADDDSLCAHPFVKAFFLAEITLVGKHHNLRSFEIPAAVHLTTTSFSADNGLQTYSEKNSRHSIHKLFKTEIDQMYESLELSRKNTKHAVGELLRSELSLPSAYTAASLSGNGGDVASGHAVLDGITFAQVGGDSLSAVKLRRAIKQQFEVDVPLDVLMDPTMSLEGLVSLVSDPVRISTASASASAQVDVQSVVALDPSWTPVPKLPKGEETAATSIFITGATGFLGTALLCELLSSTTYQIYCLVRPSSVLANVSSFAEHIFSSGLIPNLTMNAANDLMSHRITLIHGSLDLPHFGLDTAAWASLNTLVSHIIHSAAHVNHVLPYHILAPSNVEGTRTCLEMCTMTRHKRLIHVSTVSVISHGFAFDRPLSQSSIPKSLINMASGYTSSKYLAEILVWTAIVKDFDAVVIRPGFIGSASTSGFSNPTDIDNRLIRGLAMLGAAPSFPFVIPLATMPVDYMAKAILKASDLKDETTILEDGRCFHLESGDDALSFSLIVEELKSRGYIQKELSFDEWKVLLQKMDETNPLFTLTETLSSRASFPNREPRGSEEATQERLLSKLGVPSPQTGSLFVKKWIDWLEQNGHLKRP